MGNRNSEQCDSISQSEIPLSGVGLCLEDRGHEILVGNILSSSPALAAGIQTGDILFTVDGFRVESLSAKQVASSMIIGEPGSLVEIAVHRPEIEDLLTFNLLRKPLSVLSTPSTRAHMKLLTQDQALAQVKAESHSLQSIIHL